MRGSGRPVWEDTAPAEDLALLEPGIPADWDATPDVLVVGGGAIGLAVAAFCTNADMRVLLIERDRLANAASGRAAGGLSPDVHPEHGDTWHALATASLALHRELDAEWNYGLRTIDVLIPPDLRIPNQAHVDPLRMAAAFARRAGAIATSVEFVDWQIERDRVSRVRTTNGDVTPGAVVVATGTAGSLCETNERWVKGHLIATEPAPFDLRDLVAFDILVLQLDDGRLVAGGTRDLDDESLDVDDRVVRAIESRMVELVPLAKGLRTTHAWCCFRPCSPDEQPLIDVVPGLTNAWIASGLFTTGLLMAPIVGKTIAEWIATQRPQGLDSFALARLAKR